MAQPAPPPSALAALPPAPPMFGLLVSGRPLLVDWRVAGENKLLIEIPQPASVNELSIFMLPGFSLPPDRGVLIFYAPPPFSNWANLGALGPSKPSLTVRTGWGSQPELAAAPVVQLGLSVEPADAVMSAASALDSQEWDKLGFAQLLARDLTEFLSSFNEGSRLVLPSDAVDRWYKKFESKFRHDPTFLYRKHG